MSRRARYPHYRQKILQTAEVLRRKQFRGRTAAIARPEKTVSFRQACMNRLGWLV